MAAPPSTMNQYSSFCPPLYFQAGAYSWSLPMPPPALNHSTSAAVGKFCPIQIRNISTTPRVKAKLMKLCVYFAHSDQVLKASGPIQGSSNARPKVMLRPVMPSTMKVEAASQCTKRSKALKRTMVRPRTAALDLHGAAPQIEDDEQRQHAEDGDAADPFQRDGAEGRASRGRPDGSGWPPSCPECSPGRRSRRP